MKFLEFGSLGFYRFFDFQKYFNFSIYKYSLTTYYSYKKQSDIVSDANLLRDKLFLLERLHKSSTLQDSEEERESFLANLDIILKILEKYYPENEVLKYKRESILMERELFLKFFENLRYLNFKVDLKREVEAFERKYQNPYSCIKLGTFFIIDEFLTRLKDAINFFTNEANKNNLDLIHSRIKDYYERLEKIKNSSEIRDSHKSFIIKHTNEKIEEILNYHSLDINKITIKSAFLELLFANFEQFFALILELIELFNSVDKIIEFGITDIPNEIYNEWNAIIYNKKKDIQKIILLTDNIFQKRLVSTINSGTWRFTFFTLSPRQVDTFQISLNIKKDFNDVEEAIKDYKGQIERMQSFLNKASKKLNSNYLKGFY